jgi:ribonuclease VapC
MFIDASAPVAILLGEPAAERIAKTLKAHRTQRLVTNVIAVWEAAAALRAKRGGSTEVVESDVARLLETAAIETVDVGPADLSVALVAFDRYGRHRYPEAKTRNTGLNMGDCVYYATAKSLGASVLTTDAGFARTDLVVTLVT